MQGPLQIRFHGMDPSSVLSEVIEEKVSSLEHLFGHITDCTVALEKTHHKHQKGNTLRVTIEIRVPGSDLVVSREHTLNATHDDPLIVLKDSFDAAKRKLQDYARKMRGEVKTHENPYHEGLIARIFHDDGYGFIENGDQREIFFHENSVIKGNFEDLVVGSKVRFVEELGEKGPQASSVFTIKI